MGSEFKGGLRENKSTIKREKKEKDDSPAIEKRCQSSKRIKYGNYKAR